MKFLLTFYYEVVCNFRVIVIFLKEKKKYSKFSNIAIVDDNNVDV